MANTWKYMLFLALSLLAMGAYAPPYLEAIANSRWVDTIGVLITQSLAAVRPDARVSPVDPVAAANVDEDLDYRVAQRMKSTEAWRAFLTAHPDGPHAQLARAELDRLVSPQASPMAGPAGAVEARSSDAKTSAEAASPGGPAAPRPEAVTPASDDICRQDEERLDRLSDNLTSDGVIRSLIGLRCERLRPQLLRLAERVDDKAPAAAPDAGQGRSSIVSPAPIVPTTAAPLPPRRAIEPQNNIRPGAASRRLQARARASPSPAPSLPPILLALFGEQPTKPAPVRRMRASGRLGASGLSAAAGVGGAARTSAGNR
jgi:hypothetical protein